MRKDLQKFAERKMPLFNLAISLWSHNLFLKNTVGYGFTKSLFTHKAGFCELNASKKETAQIVKHLLRLLQNHDPLFQICYKKSQALNIKADELLVKYKNKNFKINSNSYKQAFNILEDNFNYCTILPFWVLYSINSALENKGSKQTFSKERAMYEELKGQTRYPQLLYTIFSKYFNKAAKILNTSPELASCIIPDELKQIVTGKKVVSVAELKKRWDWCAINLNRKPYKVNFTFDQNSFSSQLVKTNKNITELKGSVAFKGKVRGQIKIVNSIEDMKKFKKGNILISIQSSPSLMPVITKCSAIITDEGGIMCHASIISRELKKPCVIGTKIATKIFKDGDLVEVDANKGIVKKL